MLIFDQGTYASCQEAPYPVATISVLAKTQMHLGQNTMSDVSRPGHVHVMFGTLICVGCAAHTMNLVARVHTVSYPAV